MIALLWSMFVLHVLAAYEGIHNLSERAYQRTVERKTDKTSAFSAVLIAMLFLYHAVRETFK